MYDYTKPQDTIERIDDAQVVFCNKVLITKEVMDVCKNIMYIGLFSTGTNNVDMEEAKRRNIKVNNVPGYSTNAVAQQVFSYILDYTNKISLYAKSVKAGDWIRSESFSYFNYPTYELDSLSLGIVGFGSIGRRVYQVAKVFGLKVYAYTRHIPDGFKDIEFVSFEDVLKNSDVVSLHCPLTEETNGIINKDSLRLMKSTGVLINTARGQLVNENDLYDALNNKVLAFAYLDVIAVEPMDKNNILKDLNNCIITPHTAWASRQTRQRLLDIAIYKYKEYLKNEQI